jgi:hypothetical protein
MASSSPSSPSLFQNSPRACPPGRGGAPRPAPGHLKSLSCGTWFARKTKKKKEAEQQGGQRGVERARAFFRRERVKRREREKKSKKIKGFFSKHYSEPLTSSSSLFALRSRYRFRSASGVYQSFFRPAVAHTHAPSLAAARKPTQHPERCSALRPLEAACRRRQFCRRLRRRPLASSAAPPLLPPPLLLFLASASSPTRAVRLARSDR